MSDYKPREFWISKGEYDGDLGVPTPFYSSVLTREEVADLWDGKEGFKRFVHVREVLPTPETDQPAHLTKLLNAVDTACWCLDVKKNTRKWEHCKVDWKNALIELQEAWQMYKYENGDL